MLRKCLIFLTREYFKIFIFKNFYIVLLLIHLFINYVVFKYAANCAFFLAAVFLCNIFFFVPLSIKL